MWCRSLPMKTSSFIINEGRPVGCDVSPCVCKYKGCCDYMVKRGTLQTNVTLTLILFNITIGNLIVSGNKCREAKLK